MPRSNRVVYKCFEHLIANVNDETVVGSMTASSDTALSEGAADEAAGTVM
jgi:hypothetical protein